MNKAVRNVAIVLVLAALVAFVPGGDALSRTLILAISLAFLAGIGFLAYRLYRDQQTLIAGLGDLRRAIFYGAVGLMALLIAGYQAFASFGSGLVLWLALLLVSAGTIFWVVRDANRYG